MFFNSIVGNSYVVEDAGMGISNMIPVKNYSDCYLYGKGNYEKELIEFVLKSTYLDKKNEGFLDLINDVKRQRISNALVKVLESDNTILCVGPKPMPRAFKTFVAKDMKGDKTKLKLYIDLTNLVDCTKTRYEYRTSYLNTIISYLMAGMNAMIYYVQTNKIINNTNLTEYGIECFSGMIYYIIDYLRLSGDPNTRNKVKYLASKYYQINLLGKEESADSVENWALKISGMSVNEADILMMNIKTKNPYLNIYTFTQALSEYFKAPSLTIDVMLDKWLYTFGSGTQFGLELYPAFANMMIYTYIGAYLLNQKTIEKIVGKPMQEFVTKIIQIGGELI